MHEGISQLEINKHLFRQLKIGDYVMLLGNQCPTKPYSIPDFLYSKLLNKALKINYFSKRLEMFGVEDYTYAFHYMDIDYDSIYTAPTKRMTAGLPGHKPNLPNI